LRQAQSGLMTLAQVTVVAVALGLTGATVAAALGYLPWPELSLRWGGAYVPAFGMWLQVGLTALFVLLCFYLPANTRMARLEMGHRSFHMSLEDVRRAYEIAHAADRRSVFTLSSEFEAMRQRMEHLKKHPDLSDLEPELLELAAQMSIESRDLARTYSEDRVNRARAFLTQRQEEVSRTADRIRLAKMTCDELRRWLRDIEAAERANHQQIRRLEADLREVLPALGYEMDDPREPNVVTLPVVKPG
jgi:hypothetical protein